MVRSGLSPALSAGRQARFAHLRSGLSPALSAGRRPSAGRIDGEDEPTVYGLEPRGRDGSLGA